MQIGPSLMGSEKRGRMSAGLRGRARRVVRLSSVRGHVLVLRPEHMITRGHDTPPMAGCDHRRLGETQSGAVRVNGKDEERQRGCGRRGGGGGVRGGGGVMEGVSTGTGGGVRGGGGVDRKSTRLNSSH